MTATAGRSTRWLNRDGHPYGAGTAIRRMVVDGTTLALPTGAEGAVLELLLLSAGRVVPAATPVDALWGEDLPANANNALQGCVSRLRRALVDAGLPAEMLITRRPGYLLDMTRRRGHPCSACCPWSET